MKSLTKCQYCVTENTPDFKYCNVCGKLRKDINNFKQAYKFFLAVALLLFFGYFIMLAVDFGAWFLGGFFVTSFFFSIAIILALVYYFRYRYQLKK